MKKILIIEDDPQVRDNIQDVLSLEEFCTITATNGLEGLALAKEEHPDVIICDITMPKLSGYDVLKALRQDEETEIIPFIFLSGKADRMDFRQGIVLGADDYLTKPFTPTELRQAIMTRLEKQAQLEHQAQRQLGELRQSIALSLPQELKAPLVGIMNGVRLLRNCYDPIDQTEAMALLDIIERSGSRLQQLIQNFITYADLELIAANQDSLAALQTGRAQCFPMATIQTIAHQKAEQYQREADLHLMVQDAWAKISEVRLRKAIAEVIDNAFKFSLPGSPVKITSSLKDGSFHLFVIDNGRGMTVEQIAAVGAYMQFQRKLYEQQGSGLGLAIAKRTFELFGGELAIESFPGRQTIVRMSVPAVPHP